MHPEETRTIVAQAVEETLLRMGIDISSADAVTAMQADFAFVRRQRKTAEAIRAHALKTFFAVLGAGMLGLCSWLATSLAWKGH